MTVCYFGHYNPAHPRNVIFLKCLGRAGYIVQEIHSRRRGVLRYGELAWKLWRRRRGIDAVMVGFPGQQPLLIARLVYRGPVIFNALLSLYDATIADRQEYALRHPRAWYYWLLDFMSFQSASHLVFDCEAHRTFVNRVFLVPFQKMSVIYLGADEDVFSPQRADIPPPPPCEGVDKGGSYEIHYYSSFIPTHGTDVIIQAAKLLENEGVRFVLSGRGQCYARDRALADERGVKNVQFIERFSTPQELHQFIGSSWICLGIFGLRPRTDRIIASKVFEALCCGKPLVTEYTQAGAEVLKDHESVLFVPPHDPERLADAIRQLQRDDMLRRKIARGGREAYERHASYAVITAQLRALIAQHA